MLQGWFIFPNSIIASACLIMTCTALLFFIRAWRGKCIDDHPLCRRCSYDLIGNIHAKTCPECGQGLRSAHNIRIGHRIIRRVSFITTGITLAALIVTTIALDQLLTRASIDLPEWWLALELQSNDAKTVDDAMFDLETRWRDGKMSRDEYGQYLLQYMQHPQIDKSHNVTLSMYLYEFFRGSAGIEDIWTSTLFAPAVDAHIELVKPNKYREWPGIIIKANLKDNRFRLMDASMVLVVQKVIINGKRYDPQNNRAEPDAIPPKDQVLYWASRELSCVFNERTIDMEIDLPADEEIRTVTIELGPYIPGCIEVDNDNHGPSPQLWRKTITYAKE